jgi:hypothetical protein
MGGSLRSVGISIATAHAHSIGSSIETLAVITVVSTRSHMERRRAHVCVIRPAVTWFL